MIDKQYNKFCSIAFTAAPESPACKPSHQGCGYRRKYPWLVYMASFAVLFILSAVSYAETVRGTVKLKTEEDAGKVVVYIEKAGGVFIPPEKRPIMDQIDLIFVPYVLPVVIGTTVDFHNSDDVLNNIFTPSSGYKFNLGTYPKGVVRSYTFNRLGEVVLLCNIHPDMEGYILVLQNPYFAVLDKRGEYRINNVPPGTYNMKMWYKKKISPVYTITVEKGREAVLDFK
jgi:plastocyanin